LKDLSTKKTTYVWKREKHGLLERKVIRTLVTTIGGETLRSFLRFGSVIKYSVFVVVSRSAFLLLHIYK
jgi:hypothetical protein